MTETTHYMQMYEFGLYPAGQQLIPSLHWFKLSSTKPLDCEISTVSDVNKPGLGAWDMEKMYGFFQKKKSRPFPQ